MNDGQDDNIGKGMCTGLVHSMLSLIKMLKIFLGGGLKVKVCTLLIFEIVKVFWNMGAGAHRTQMLENMI